MSMQQHDQLSRRRFLKGLGMTGAALGLAACAQPTPTPVPSTKAPAAPVATAVPAATAAPVATKAVAPTVAPTPTAFKTTGAKGSINVIAWNDVKDAFKTVFQAFTAETNIGVNYQIAPSDYVQYYDMMTTRLASNDDTVDVVLYRDMEGNKLNAAGWVQDINTIIAAKKIDVSDITKGAIASVTVNGKLSMLPFSHDSELLFWRTDWAEEAGIKAVPTTWDEWLDAAKKLTKAPDRYGIGLSGAKAYLPHEIKKWASQAGGSILKLDDPATKQAITFYKDLFATHKVAQPATPEQIYYDVWLAYQENKYASWWCWDAYYPALTRNEKFWKNQVILALPPKGPKNAAISTALWGWMVGAFTKKADLCAEFVAFVTRPSSQKMHMALRGNVPSHSALWTDPEIQKVAPSTILLSDLIKKEGDARFEGVPSHPNYSAICAAIGDQLNSYFTGQATLDDAVRRATEKITPLLK